MVEMGTDYYEAIKSIGFYLSPANKIQKLPAGGDYNTGEKFQWQ